MIPIPYGAWHSPVPASALTDGRVSIEEVRIDGPDTYWLEGRPAEAGRVVLVRHHGGTGSVADVTPPPLNVRSRVHEYGGGAYAVADRTVVLSHAGDGRVYRGAVGGDATLPGPDAEPGTAAVPITPDGADVRFGGLVLRGEHVLAVREDHRGDGEPANALVLLDLEGPNTDYGRVLWDRSDFVSRPALSPDGAEVAWVGWDHPDMPWDASVLRRARLDGGRLSGVEVLAGGPGISVVAPRWAPDGALWFAEDSSGWWTLHRHTGHVGQLGPIEAVERVAADAVSPPWMLGFSDYAFLPDGRVLTRRWVDGVARLEALDPVGGGTTPAELDGVTFDQLRSAGDEVALLVGHPDRPAEVLRGTLDVSPDGPPGMRCEVLHRAGEPVADRAYASVAEPVSWAGPAGPVHGLFYPPTNPRCTAPDGELPPLVVMVHGGPTARTEPAYAPVVQFWTTRGLAVLHVNYSGSSGHGRAYRDRLRGEWGVLDVAECVTGAQAMAAARRADRDRMVIRGGSAGGYTVLQALTTSSTFAAGASYFGIGDLEAMTRDTHKFESRYLDRLVAPWPEQREVYAARSPVHHVGDLRGGLILFQGGRDAVVPPSQAEEMAAAVRAAGAPCELTVYEEEAHGFRSAHAIEDSIQRELEFYGRVLGFTPA